MRFGLLPAASMIVGPLDQLWHMTLFAGVSIVTHVTAPEGSGQR
jgi:hypothetical protein